MAEGDYWRDLFEKGIISWEEEWVRLFFNFNMNILHIEYV